MKIGGIIQARMGSTRLPNKVLAEIEGTPLLSHIINRVSKSNRCQKWILATTINCRDNPLEDLAKRHKIEFFRGNEEDVLDRFYHAACKYELDVVIRVTADDAFKDPEIIDMLVEHFSKSDSDYVSNTIEHTYPEGLDIEVFSFYALERAYSEAKQSFLRQHVTPYIWMNPKLFKTTNIKNAVDYSEMRWTVDTQEDLDFARAVYKKLYSDKNLFHMQDIICLLENDINIAKLMPTIPRNDGLMKSIKNENAN